MDVKRSDPVRYSINIPDDEFPDWEDEITATKVESTDRAHHWWEISGDNTGVGNLALHAYMIPHLRQLLDAIEKHEAK